MQIKVSITNDPKNIFGIFYFETENKEFIEEIQKYKCPCRVLYFIDDFRKANPNEVKELIESEITNLDLVIDLKERQQEIISSYKYSFVPEIYIEQTKDLLDKYGNELAEEDLNDYSQGSDRGYEMSLDNMLYRN